MNKFFLLSFLLILDLNSISLAEDLIKNSKIWDARELFSNSTLNNIIPVKEGFVLNNQILIENDGAAAGYFSSPSALEVIKKNVILKKILIIKNLPIKEAFIAVLIYPDYPSEPNNGRHIIINVNGHDIQYEVKHFWTRVPVPVNFLIVGENNITLRTFERDAKFKTYIALKDNFKFGTSEAINREQRSLKSTDGGKTWSENLGINGQANGEYSIRLKLIAFHFNGYLITPVIDLADNSDIDNVIKRKVDINNFVVKINRIEPEGTKIIIEQRSGVTRNINNEWSRWSNYNEKNKNSILGRFLQLRITFISHSHLESPVLKNLSITSEYKIHDSESSNTIHVLSLKNYPLINSSFSFEYENPKLDKLQSFRKKYNLDEVINNSSTEFEKALKLKNWVAKQWNWHLLKPDEDIIEWNADKILTPDKDGNVGGFCANYAIVFMQALQSFGIHCRFVIMNYSVWGGHEVVEFWSNDFGKWILMDPNYDSYFTSSETGIPLNALELHKIFLNAYYPNSIVDRNNWSRKAFVEKAKKVGRNMPVNCIIGGGADNNTLSKYEWWKPVVDLYPYPGGMGLLNAGYLRYMPRSNFLSKPYPIPINEGRTHWPWTGYYCWYDEKTPPVVEHRYFTTRSNDLYWNLNQVDYSVSINASHLIFELTSNSPSFNHYEFFFNNKKFETTENVIDLNLVHGINEIKIYVVDIVGNKGTESYVNLIYFPYNQQN